MRIAIGMGIVAAAIWANALLEASGDAKNRAVHPEKIGIDSRTGRPYLDFTKPIFAVKGTPLCPSDEELGAVLENKPNLCRFALEDFPVSKMERRGILFPRYRVRFTDGKTAEAWIPLTGIRN